MSLKVPSAHVVRATATLLLLVGLARRSATAVVAFIVPAVAWGWTFHPKLSDVPVSRRDLVVVQDDGPGVPALLLPLLGRRFERGASSAEGSGLGLAIVGAIARQSGARLRLQSPAAGDRGLRAELRFGET